MLENTLINKIYNFVPAYSSRLFVYNYFFDKKDLGSVLNDKVWWQENIFSRDSESSSE